MLYLYGTADQLEIAQCTARNISLFAGRRWGKNFGVRNRAMYRCTRPGHKHCFASPIYAQCVKEYNFFISNPGCRRFIKKSEKQPFPKIIFKSAAELHFRSLERPDSLRGDEYDEIDVDEIQNVGQDTVQFVLRPCLASRMGTFLIMGQFRGKNWYYEDYYLKGLTDTTGRYKSFRFPSSSGIVFQSEEGRLELEEEMARVPRLVREQEWECLPSANMACAFNHDDIRACTRGEYQPTGGTSEYVMGIDLGMHKDPTALVVMDAKTATVVYSEAMPVGQDHKRSAARARQIWDRFGKPEPVVDVTGGATGGHHEHSAYTRIYEEAMPNVRPYTWTRDNKVKMVYNLSLALEKHELNIAPENVVLLKQLGMYEYDKRPNGTYDYHGPKGSDDDCVAALLMAWEARRRGWYGPARNNLNALGSIM